MSPRHQGRLQVDIELRCLPEVLASRPAGTDRKLAYPIKGHRKGLYYLVYFRTEGKNVVTIGGELLPDGNDPADDDSAHRSQAGRYPAAVQRSDEHAAVLQADTEQPADENGNGRGR